MASAGEHRDGRSIGYCLSDTTAEIVRVNRRGGPEGVIDARELIEHARFHEPLHLPCDTRVTIPDAVLEHAA